MKNKITKALSNPFNRKKTYELNPAAPDSFVHPSDHDQLYKEKAFTPEATPQFNKMDYLNLTSENKPANATYTKSRKVGITLNPGTPKDQIDARNIAVNAAKSLMQDNRERAESVTSAIQRQRSYSSEIIGSQGVLTIKNDLLAPDMTTKNASNWSLNNLMVQTEKSARKVATNVIKPARNLLLANRADASKNSGCTVSIFLIEGSGLPGRDRNGYSDPFCEFKIASEAYTSKVIWHSLNPQWRERFSLNYNENENDRLRIKVWDRDRIGNDFIGHATIYLASYEPNTYHNLWLELDEGNGKLHLAMHITPHNSNEKLRNDVDERAHTYETIQNLPQLLKSVGKVKLQIIRAWGLASKDLNGKSDPFCVIRLVEQEERTKTAYRTLNPCWGETFELEVADVHSVLTITVLDEDKYHEKSEFLGKVAIPLLSIANNYAHGSWIMLKDETLLNAAKGALFVRIGLEYNHFTAAVRTFLKKPEENTDVPAQAFRPIQFKNDVTRVQEQADPFLDAMYLIKLSLTWKKPLFSFLSFVAYMLVVQYIQVWMLPLVLVVLLLINMLRYGSTSMASFALRGKKKYSIPPPILHTKKKNIMKRCRKKLDMKKKSNTGLNDTEKSLEQFEEAIRKFAADYKRKKKKSNTGLNDTEKSLEQFAADYKRKKSPLNHRPETNLINMLQSAQEAIINVQEIIAEFADGVERVYNLFKFKSPWLSFLAMLVLTTISLVLYIIPFRTLLHIIGIHKFSKRLIRPNAPVSDEIYNFILRSLTDLEVRKYAEVPVPKESGFDESCPFEEFLRLHEDEECSSNENLNEIGDDEAEMVIAGPLRNEVENLYSDSDERSYEEQPTSSRTVVVENSFDGLTPEEQKRLDLQKSQEKRMKKMKENRRQREEQNEKINSEKRKKEEEEAQKKQQREERRKQALARYRQRKNSETDASSSSTFGRPRMPKSQSHTFGTKSASTLDLSPKKQERCDSTVTLRQKTGRGRPRPISSYANSKQKASDAPTCSGSSTFKIRRSSSSDARGSSSNLGTLRRDADIKLYKQPVLKSNKALMLNAVRDSIFPGPVDANNRSLLQDAIKNTEGSHYVILFRDQSRCLFRGLYIFKGEQQKLYKAYGIGPGHVTNEMVERFYKYSSGAKQFKVMNSIKHFSIQVDAFTLEPELWKKR